MKGDYTRQTFRPEKHYTGVRMQQGRVQTDSDWNEQTDIQAYLQSAVTQDLFGAAGAPLGSPGFAVQGVTSAGALATSAGPISTFTIGAGRYYVSGVLCENEAAVDVLKQPDLPLPAGAAAFFSAPGVYLLYLDVWPRHITALEDPAILEAALGGPDTGTRVKTVWQVKSRQLGSLAALTPDLASPRSWPAALQAEWAAVVSLNPGLLSLDLDSAVRRLDNRLYRIEVHSSDGAALVLKWSRDNAALAWRHSFKSDTQVTLSGAAIESEGLAPGQLVELIDDPRELRGDPGLLYQILGIASDATLGFTVTLGPVGAAGLPAQPTLTAANLAPASSKLRRWDGVQVIPLSGPGATVPTAASPVKVPLEAGLSAQLWGGGYRPCDYWICAARTDTGIEWPRAADGSSGRLPPSGIAHRYAPLALVQLAAGAQLVSLIDCRTRLPSLGDTADARTVQGLATQLGTVQSSVTSLASQVNSTAVGLPALQAQLSDPAMGLLALSSLISDLQEDAAAKVTMRTAAVFNSINIPAIAMAGLQAASVWVAFFENSLQDIFLYQPWAQLRLVPEIDVSAVVSGLALKDYSAVPSFSVNASVGAYNGDRNGLLVSLVKLSGNFDNVVVSLIVSGRLRSVKGVGAYADPATGQVHVFVTTRLGDVRHRTRSGSATGATWSSWVNRGFPADFVGGTPVPFCVSTGTSSYQGMLVALAGGSVGLLTQSAGGGWQWDVRSFQDAALLRPAVVATPPTATGNGFLSLYWLASSAQLVFTTQPAVLREGRSGSDGYTLTANAAQPSTTSIAQISQSPPAGVSGFSSGPIGFSTPGGHFGVLAVIGRQLWELCRPTAPVPPAAPAAPTWKLVNNFGGLCVRVCCAVFVAGTSGRTPYVSILALNQSLQLVELRGQDTASGILQSNPVWNMQNTPLGAPFDISAAATPDPSWPANSGARRCAHTLALCPGGLVSAAATGQSTGVLMTAFVVDMQDGSIHEFYATDPQGTGAISWFWKYRGFLPGTYPATDPAAVNLGNGAVGCFVAGANGHVFELGPSYLTDHGRPF